jgi:hypothetical protein
MLSLVDGRLCHSSEPSRNGEIWLILLATVIENTGKRDENQHAAGPLDPGRSFLNLRLTGFGGAASSAPLLIPDLRA